MPEDELIPRWATSVVAEMLQESRAVALIGPRQSGKSTLAKELLAPHWPARYITLDADENRLRAIEDPTGFVADLEGPTIIDEIQRAPGLMLALKIRLDTNNSPGQFLITGSANLLQVRTVQDTLPGRVIYQDIWPLTQAEIERRSTEVLTGLFEGEIPNIHGATIGARSYLDRFVKGGLPGPLRSSGRVRAAFFESYLNAIVERDVPDLSALRTLDGPARMLRLVAARSAMTLNVASLARDLQTDNKTADHHLRILRDLMLIRVHQPWFANLGSRQAKTPKLYVTDPGLMASLAGTDTRGLERNSTLLGSFLETAVCMEIVRLVSIGATPPRAFHYRDKKQREVDIILERPDGRVVGIEVKAGATVTPSDFRTLRYLRDGLGGRFAAGIVLHTGAETVPSGERLAAVPIEALWS